MTPKGANLQATDLLEISELSGTGYITKSITGQEIINAAGGGGSQNLQQVTDIGATTTNAITITKSGSSDTLIVNHTSGSGIGVMITKGGNGEGLKVDKTSGSGNAVTVNGTLEASNIVKTGGTSTQFLMADGSTSTAVQSINLNGQPNTANTGLSGALRYFGFSNNAVSTIESLRRTFLPNACTLKNFYIRTNSTQPASGSHVLTILKNGVATSIVVTIAAGSAAGVFSDTTNSVSFAAGDEVSIQAVNNATGNSGGIVTFSIGNL